MWFAFALAVASSAAPSQSAPSQPAAAQAAKPAKAVAGADTVVCKSVIETGTHFTTKDCRTRAEWDDMAAESHQLVSTAQGSGQPH